MKPLAIDLFCGLGGWAEGLLAEGWRVVGYDIEAHDYGTGGYPGELVIRDVRSIHGSEFRDAALIVASPPCQAYSYRAMPWSRAKALPPPDNTLFNECFRIQREASAAAGHHIPLIVENVRGAQKWVGRAQWHYGSFYLWGDVPALMPMTLPKTVMKRGVTHRSDGATNFHGQKASEGSCARLPGAKGGRISGWPHAQESDTVKVAGVDFNDRSSPGFNVAAAQRYREGVKLSQSGDAWFDGKPRDKMLGDKGPAAYGSRSNSRKAASAMIAKIPAPLARHIAQCFYPRGEE